jgi:hypothetical protein
MIILCAWAGSRLAAGDRQPAAEPSVTIASYVIVAEIDPATGGLSARASIGLRARRDLGRRLEFFLNEGLRMTSAGASDTSERRSLPFSQRGRPVAAVLPRDVKEGDSFTLDVAYEGTLSSEPSDLCRISPRFTELSQYASWFPRFPGPEEFPFDMTIVLPADQEVISRGGKVSDQITGDRRRVRFQGRTAARDLLVIASSSWKSAGTRPGIPVRHIDLTEEQAEGVAEEFGWIIGFYGERFGGAAAEAGGAPTVVVLPRLGGSYARPPLIVLDTEGKDLWLATPEGARAEFHRRAHEAAHLLWPWADSSTSDDWLNEALAEYGALQASAKRFGQERERDLVRGYRQRVVSLDPPRSIAATFRIDPWAGTLFYEKGALILRMLDDLLRAAPGGSDRPGLAGVLTAYRTISAPSTGDFERIASQAAGRSLTSFFDLWVRSARFPDLWLRMKSAEPAGGASDQFMLRGEVLSGLEPVEGLQVTVAALAPGLRHDIRVDLRDRATPFESLAPFAPDRVELDPDLIIPRRDSVYQEDLLEAARLGRATALTHEGRHAEEMKQYQLAVDLYTRASGLLPSDMLPPYRIGRIYHALGDAARALEYHVRALDARAQHQELRAWNRVRIGQMMDVLGRRREAKRAYRGALAEQDYQGAHEEALRVLRHRRP